MAAAAARAAASSATPPSTASWARPSADLPGGATFAAQFQAHYAAYGIPDLVKGDVACAQCHMPKTAKSGAGTTGIAPGGTQYYLGDISSHLFDDPSKNDIAVKDPEMMALPYTNACGSCHPQVP